jgi:hypothetical protein
LSLVFRFGRETAGFADAETSVNLDALIMGLPKIRVLNVARVGQTHTKWNAVSSSNWQDAQAGLVVSPILWRCLLSQQCPVIRETKILSCFWLMRYLVICNSGCLIQSLDCLVKARIAYTSVWKTVASEPSAWFPYI